MAEGAKMMLVYTIVENKGSEKSFFVKIGACFHNRDVMPSPALCGVSATTVRSRPHFQ